VGIIIPNKHRKYVTDIRNLYLDTLFAEVPLFTPPFVVMMMYGGDKWQLSGILILTEDNDLMAQLPE
ncbi:MAG: hypothetical protein ACW992_02745, partial [Candidatus Thorarchaeota archaeon]